MIVLRSTYNSLEAKHYELNVKFQRLLNQWNELVNKINSKGGQQFLDSIPHLGAQLLSKDDIKRLLPLVHPDKHGGKQSSVEMTQKLLALREAS